MTSRFKLTTLAAALIAASPAFADLTNGPDPYASGLGFDKPQEASWGSWTRGAGNSIYAEWDTYLDATYAGVRTAAPDVGSYNATDVNIGWNSGTFAASSGNLYSFTVTEVFNVNLKNTTLTGPVRIALQTETWGTDIIPSSVLLNGVATTGTITYTDPEYPTTQGDVQLNQRLFVWNLAVAPTSYKFDFSSAMHSSLAQVSVDIGQVTAVPEPGEWAMMLAGLGAIGVIARRRRKA